jgi:hypothetical protein
MPDFVCRVCLSMIVIVIVLIRNTMTFLKFNFSDFKLLKPSFYVSWSLGRTGTHLVHHAKITIDFNSNSTKKPRSEPYSSSSTYALVGLPSRMSLPPRLLSLFLCLLSLYLLRRTTIASTLSLHIQLTSSTLSLPPRLLNLPAS